MLSGEMSGSGNRSGPITVVAGSGSAGNMPTSRLRASSACADPPGAGEGGGKAGRSDAGAETGSISPHSNSRSVPKRCSSLNCEVRNRPATRCRDSRKSVSSP